ncbi:MAG: site-specific integrase [Gammaproteobacteria bacterium]|nr:site-specific integrase [Gammaproteobacteria bacterium]
MEFTIESIRALQPRPHPFFLTEGGSPGFAVKVQKTGSKSFYYRKKEKGRRVDISLGCDLELARLKYDSLMAQESLIRDRERSAALGHTAGSTLLQLSAVPMGRQPTNPLYYPGVTFAVLAARFMAEHVFPNLRPATARNYEFYLDKVQKDLRGSAFVTGQISVDEARQELKAYIHRMKASTPVQANRIRETLSSCFKWGAYEDLSYSSPVYGIRVFKETPRTRRFTQTELPSFFKVLRDGNYGWRPAHCLRLILATGLRASEALGIKPEHIDWKAETLLIPHTKNGEPFVVPLVPLTLQILKECTEGRPANLPIFQTSVFGIRQVCQRVSQKAGITPCSTHDLRRTFATLLGELGVSVPVISRCLNHTAGGSVTTRVYALHSMLGEKRSALQMAADKLISFGCLSAPPATDGPCALGSPQLSN